jgi:hypothetical protein
VLAVGFQYPSNWPVSLKFVIEVAEPEAPLLYSACFPVRIESREHLSHRNQQTKLLCTVTDSGIFALGSFSSETLIPRFISSKDDQSLQWWHMAHSIAQGMEEARFCLCEPFNYGYCFA